MHENKLPYTFVAHDKHDERHLGAVNMPIYQNTLFSYARSNEPGPFKYSRMGNPNVQELEKKLAVLEGGDKAQCFASGMAAISASILSTVRAGDHIICVDQVYYGTREFLDLFLQRYGVRVTYVDGTSIDKIAAAIMDNTVLIYLESPTSYYFQLQDLNACVELAKSRGLSTIIDNTWASPCYQNPLRLGIDIVVHSLTKYVGGHSDVLGGAAIGRADRIDQLSRINHQVLGGIMSPHTANLMLRGLRTLPLRMERLSRSTQVIAEYLNTVPCIRRVNFPGLASHPQHMLANKQMGGCGSLMSIEIEGTIDQTRAWVDELQYFRIGLSFGGYESLVLVVGASPDSTDAHPITLVRLNIGLEEPEDLIEDLSRIYKI